MKLQSYLYKQVVFVTQYNYRDVGTVVYLNNGQPGIITKTAKYYISDIKSLKLSQ